MIMKKLALSKKLLLVVFIILTTLLGYRLLFTNIGNDLSNHDKEFTEINVGPKKTIFTVEIVSTEGSRQEGLSGRAGLEQNHGMLFVFDEPQNACIWMKDMMFDIDILWFDADMKLVNIKKAATPEAYPESYCPSLPTKYVLEINSGLIEQNDFRLGDKFNQQEYGIKL